MVGNQNLIWKLPGVPNLLHHCDPTNIECVIETMLKARNISAALSNSFISPLSNGNYPTTTPIYASALITTSGLPIVSSLSENPLSPSISPKLKIYSLFAASAWSEYTKALLFSSVQPDITDEHRIENGNRNGNGNGNGNADDIDSNSNIDLNWLSIDVDSINIIVHSIPTTDSLLLVLISERDCPSGLTHIAASNVVGVLSDGLKNYTMADDE